MNSLIFLNTVKLFPNFLAILKILFSNEICDMWYDMKLCYTIIPEIRKISFVFQNRKKKFVTIHMIPEKSTNSFHTK